MGIDRALARRPGELDVGEVRYRNRHRLPHGHSPLELRPTPAVSPTSRPERARFSSLISEGLDDAAIAAELGLSRHTVRNHVAALFPKTGARSRTKLVVWAHERGVTGESLKA